MDYQKMVDEQARVMNVASMPVREDDRGSAATDLSTIFINPKFAAKIAGTSGENGVRFVLAHELGHARGGARGGHEGEYAADRWAAQSVARLGIGFDAIKGVMSHLNLHDTKSHPAAGARAAQAQDEWTSSVRLYAPRIGKRRGLNGATIPRPDVKNARPPRLQPRSR